MDDDGNKKIDFDEFKKGLKETGLHVNDEEARELFDE
jgi:calcyphosin